MNAFLCFMTLNHNVWRLLWLRGIYVGIVQGSYEVHHSLLKTYFAIADGYLFSTLDGLDIFVTSAKAVEGMPRMGCMLD